MMLYDDAAQDAERILVEFACSSPRAVQELMMQWPPGAIVRAAPGVTLLIPAPGVEGEVYSYFADGYVGVIAPATTPHPVHGWGSVEPGELARVRCKPEELVMVREGDVTRVDIARFLKGSGSNESGL